MARYDEKRIPYATQDRLMNLFCETLSRLGTKERIYKFLKDLLNRQERLMLVRRLLIAELLEKGNDYKYIRERLSCGNSTIARVHKLLNFGRGGYKEAIKNREK